MSVFDDIIERSKGEAVRKEDKIPDMDYKKIREIVKHKLEWYTQYTCCGSRVRMEEIIGDWKVRVYQGQIVGFIEDLSLSLYKGDVCVEEHKNFKSYSTFNRVVTSFSKIIDADINK